MTLSYLLGHILPAAYALLPTEMDSPEASALLLAIGLQESRFIYRKQIDGPARGFWQFEVGGVQAVMTNSIIKPRLLPVLEALEYDIGESPTYMQVRLEDNDVLAAVFARLLLWSSPQHLPKQGEGEHAWDMYRSTWRPGRPHHETWQSYFLQAWEAVNKGHVPEPTLNA